MKNKTIRVQLHSVIYANLSKVISIIYDQIIT